MTATLSSTTPRLARALASVAMLALAPARVVVGQESGATSGSQARPATAPVSAGATTAARPGARNTARVSLAVAARAFQRGDTLRSGDFTFVDTTIVWRYSIPPADTVRVQAGWVAQRAIAAGEVLRTPSVQPPAVVTAGATVKAIYRDGAVQLELSGVAVNSAALGAPVGVRIDRTRRLEGIAIAPNTVRLR